MVPTTKVRLRFAKCGDLRLVSHHDLMRCLERMLRRAALPMAHSQGFNPRPKVVFAQALGLGIEGRREVVELELAEPVEPPEVLRRLAEVAPPGFELLEAEGVGPGRPARPVAAVYRLSGPLPEGRRGAAAAAIRTVLASPGWPYTRHRPDRDRTVEVDLRPYLLGAEIDPDGSLVLRVKLDPGGSARPEELLEALGLRDLLDAGLHLVRDAIELAGPAPAAPAPDGPRPGPTPGPAAPEGPPPTG
jgi:radical SAM-linked protein